MCGGGAHKAVLNVVDRFTPSRPLAFMFVHLKRRHGVGKGGAVVEPLEVGWDLCKRDQIPAEEEEGDERGHAGLLPLLHVLDEGADHEPQGGADGGEQREQREEQEVARGVEGLPEHVGVLGISHQEEDGAV